MEDKIMIVGFTLITIAIVVMAALFIKARNGIKLARTQGNTGDTLNAFGYKQELLRDMGGFSNFAVSFSVISILTGGVTLYGFGFNQGGAGEIGLGWPLVSIFVLFVAAGMAELTSAIPTSGAIYHWSSILGGPGWGWLTAWLNLVGQVTIVAGIDFGCAGFAASLLFDEPTKSQTLTIYAIILASHALINHIGIKIVGKLNDVSAIYHLLGVGLLIVALSYFGPSHDIRYLFDTSFSTVTDSSTPYWFAFLVGLLQAQWTITGYDASAHTSEETVNPRVRAPWGVYLSVVISTIFGFIMLALVTLSIHDQVAVAKGGSNAFIVAIEQAMGGAFGRAMVWMVTIAMWFCGLASVTSASRMIYAFARDQGLPMSKVWSKVSKKFRTPVNAIWINVMLAFLCGIFDNVYAVVTSLSVIGLYTSYMIPIFLKLRAQKKGVWNAQDDGPWTLGNWSKFVNSVAVAWIVFITVLLVIAPSDITITENYTLHYATGTAFATLLLFLFVIYMASVRKHFTGPHLGTYQDVHDRIHAHRLKANEVQKGFRNNLES
jgi:amino acid transporter